MIQAISPAFRVFYGDASAAEHRYGAVNQVKCLIEWLTESGTCDLARNIRRFARELGLIPKMTPLESPKSVVLPGLSCEP
ncbi:hypothetical protein [Methylobacterium oryzae]|uniref:hypothetical protein n=1 Tax=Methylobacterium oryzae TaxID=334852 RepID=UPI0011DD55A9|nr:hypothetical protein [Methylobacterium oryzae]